MYKCDMCSTQVLPGTKANRVVIEVRKKEYKNYEKVINGLKKLPKGYETVKEVVVCDSCAKNYKKV